MGSEKGLCHPRFFLTVVSSCFPSCNCYTVLSALKSCLTSRIYSVMKNVTRFIITDWNSQRMEGREAVTHTMMITYPTAKPSDCQLLLTAMTSYCLSWYPGSLAHGESRNTHSFEVSVSWHIAWFSNCFIFYLMFMSFMSFLGVLQETWGFPFYLFFCYHALMQHLILCVVMKVGHEASQGKDDLPSVELENNSSIGSLKAEENH